MNPQVMKNAVLRPIITVIFLALLATPVIVSRLNSQAKAGPADAREALERFGFVFEEASKKAGIEFQHQAPQLDSRLAHIMDEVASMGAAASVVDFDRDGWQDLYAINSAEGSANRLYRNKGDGTFEEVAGKLGIGAVNEKGSGVSMGAVWGDYDNDGYEDLYLNKWGRPELFHNDAGTGFTRVSEAAGLPKWLNANTALWLDYDRDGKLDLFVGGYYRDDLDLWNLADTRIMPESFEYAKNGGRKYLFHNLGGGRFEEVSAKLGLKSNRWALAAVAADLRGTGYPDIVIANDYGVAEFWANDRGKGFREIGQKTGVAERPKSGMNVSLGDVFNDGRLAVYISNISEPGYLIQGNNLWVPKPGTQGESLQYENMANALEVELGGWSFGAQFGDLNNDGQLDLFLTNGYVSGERGTNYWYDFAKVAAGNSTIIGDAANWPPTNGRSHSGFQQKHVWVNDGAGRFRNAALSVGVTETFDGRSVSLADFGNRGALDAVVAHQKGPLLLYRNTVAPGNDWIAFDLEGTTSNRSAIGAEVRVFWGGKQQLQVVSGGSGFCAQNQRRLHFGLGKGAKIEKVAIRWPSGKEQTLGAGEAAAGRIHRVEEPA